MRPLPVFRPLNASTVLMFVVSKRRLFVFSVTSFLSCFLVEAVGFISFSMCPDSYNKQNGHMTNTRRLTDITVTSSYNVWTLSAVSSVFRKVENLSQEESSYHTKISRVQQGLEGEVY